MRKIKVFDEDELVDYYNSNKKELYEYTLVELQKHLDKNKKLATIDIFEVTFQTKEKKYMSVYIDNWLDMLKEIKDWACTFQYYELAVSARDLEKQILDLES